MPLADYCAKTLKYRRMAVVADDIAYGHEMCGRLPARVRGGRRQDRAEDVLAAHACPTTPPISPSSRPNVDGVFIGFAGSNGFRYLRQFNEYGLRGKVNVRRRHDRARRGGAAQHGRRGARHRHRLLVLGRARQPGEPQVRRRVPRRSQVRPGLLRGGDLHRRRGARGSAERGQGQGRGQAGVHEGARGRSKVLACRGPVRFDDYGNVVGNVYIREGRAQGRPAGERRCIYTYPNVSQFWTYDPKAFLANPVYSRDWPPAKNLES